MLTKWIYRAEVERVKKRWSEGVEELMELEKGLNEKGLWKGDKVGRGVLARKECVPNPF